MIEHTFFLPIFTAAIDEKYFKEIKISFWDFLTFRMHRDAGGGGAGGAHAPPSFGISVNWSHYFPYLEPVKLQLANIAGR